MAKIILDIQYLKGQIKPMNAVNNRPVSGSGNADIDDPSSYDFTSTDQLFAEYVKTGLSRFTVREQQRKIRVKLRHIGFPSNQTEIKDNSMWKGKREQFFEFYVTAANYFKHKFPDFKLGGYESCGFYAIAEVTVNPGAHVSECSEYFLKYISNEKHTAPLDFFF